MPHKCHIQHRGVPHCFLYHIRYCLRVVLVPSAPGLLDSSILISFFFVFRVELTSLWSLLNVTDSSCSLSDRSQG